MADADSDGASNRDEFLAGTSPTNPWSRLFIHQVQRGSGGLSLFLSTVDGKTYVAESTDTLPATNWIVVGGVAGTGAEQVITDTNAPPRQRFYRIKLTP